MKTCSLTAFLDFLNSQSTKDFKGEGVDRYLRDYSVEEQDFLPFIYFREDTYGRNLIYKTAHYELLALTWLPEQRTRIHDHASNRCWVMMHTGSLIFKNYEWPKSEVFDPIPMGNCQTVDQGVAYIDDTIAIHSITNGSKKPAVSIHLYAGPMDRCRTYNESKKRLEWTELSYFSCPEIFQGADDVTCPPGIPRLIREP